MSGSAVTTMRIEGERVSLTSFRLFEDVVGRLEAVLGHPDLQMFPSHVALATSYRELERIVQEGVGSSGLMVLAPPIPGNSSSS